MIEITRKGKAMKIPKQQYTSEFKELSVKLVKDGHSAGAVAKELGLIEQTLRNWSRRGGKHVSSRTRRQCNEERRHAKPLGNVHIGFSV